jgi:Icc-related predicted phosphoesterase
VIIDCISDIHGSHPELGGGDLLIIAGDLTANDLDIQYKYFCEWVREQNYKKIIIIAGNHDNQIEKGFNPVYSFEYFRENNITYLCDSGIEFEGLKIWGSPWTKRFVGMNPHCMAFTSVSENGLKEKWDLIPNDTNILITHSPAYGILDTVANFWKSNEKVGSHSLKTRIQQMHHLRLHVFGHIHSDYGLINSFIKNHGCDHTYVSINAAHMNEDYDPVNKPIRIIL